MIKKKTLFVTLFALVFLTFGNTLFYPFVHDDFIFIQNNPSIADLSHIFQIFFRITSPLANISQTNPYYRPLMEIFYRLQYFFFGLNSAGYHLTNILLHLVNSLLVFALIDAITRRRNIAALTALLFAVHPVQTQSVACISGSSNLLFSLFCLSSILWYIRTFKKDAVTPDWLFLIGSLASYTSALFTKEQAIVMPLILILYEACFRGSSKASRTGRLLAIGLFLFLSLQYLLWRKTLLGNAVVPWTVISQDLIAHLFQAPRMILTYLGLVLFPHGLHYYRLIDTQEPALASWGTLCAIIFGLFIIIRTAPRENRPLILFGLGWFIIFLLPVMNIIPLIIEYSYAAAFEHFLYLPLAGILLAVFVLIEPLAAELSRKKMFPALTAGLVILLCVAASIKQNMSWRGEIPLFERTVQYEPDFGRAHLLLGRAYAKEGSCKKASPSFRKAMTIFENYRNATQAPALKDLYTGLIGKVEKALMECERK